MSKLKIFHRHQWFVTVFNNYPVLFISLHNLMTGINVIGCFIVDYRTNIDFIVQNPHNGAGTPHMLTNIPLIASPDTQLLVMFKYTVISIVIQIIGYLGIFHSFRS